MFPKIVCLYRVRCENTCEGESVSVQTLAVLEQLAPRIPETNAPVLRPSNQQEPASMNSKLQALARRNSELWAFAPRNSRQPALARRNSKLQAWARRSKGAVAGPRILKEQAPGGLEDLPKTKPCSCPCLSQGNLQTSYGKGFFKDR